MQAESYKGMTSDETLMFFSLWKRFSVGGSIYIIARLKIGTRISEVWLYEKGRKRLFFKDGAFIKNYGEK